MGLLNAVVAPDQVLPAALELADPARRRADGGVRPASRSRCASRADSTLVAGAGEGGRAARRAPAGPTDHADAVRSFLAKQPPVFSGR